MDQVAVTSHSSVTGCVIPEKWRNRPSCLEAITQRIAHIWSLFVALLRRPQEEVQAAQPLLIGEPKLFQAFQKWNNKLPQECLALQTTLIGGSQYRKTGSEGGSPTQTFNIILYMPDVSTDRRKYAEQDPKERLSFLDAVLQKQREEHSGTCARALLTPSVWAPFKTCPLNKLSSGSDARNIDYLAKIFMVNLVICAPDLRSHAYLCLPSSNDPTTTKYHAALEKAYDNLTPQERSLVHIVKDQDAFTYTQTLTHGGMAPYLILPAEETPKDQSERETTEWEGGCHPSNLRRWQSARSEIMNRLAAARGQKMSGEEMEKLTKKCSLEYKHCYGKLCSAVSSK